MVKDPVCGMTVDEKTTKIRSEFMGKTYYFCNQSCKSTFDKNPEKFASSGTGGNRACGCGCCC